MIQTEGSRTLGCRDLVELVTAYLEGALYPAARSRFEAHVATCGGCAVHVRETRRMVRLLRAVPDGGTRLRGRRGIRNAFRTWRTRTSGPVTSAER